MQKVTSKEGIKTACNEPVAANGRYITGSVTSKDSTAIAYRQLGHGQGVICVHGAMESAQSHIQLAEALADAFTVYLFDRRGRGLSGAYGKDYGIQKDVEDMDALLTKTGAHYVFGVSSGALIVLKAMLMLHTIHKAAIFEPPLSMNGSASTAWLDRYDREMAAGKVASALVTGMKGAQMGPPIFNMMPRWSLELLTNMMLASEDKKVKGDDVSWRALAPTLHYDGQIVAEMAETLESYRTVQAEVLLLGGSASPAYLKAPVYALEKVLPHAERIEFPGLNHGASGNADRGGQPERVSQELRQFFA